MKGRSILGLAGVILTLVLVLTSGPGAQTQPRFKLVLLPLLTTGDYKPMDVAATTEFMLEEFQGQQMEVITLPLPSGMNKQKAKELCAEHDALMVMWGSLHYLSFSSPQDITISLEAKVTVWVSHRRTRLHLQPKEKRFMRGPNLSLEKHRDTLALAVLTEMRSILKESLVAQASLPPIPRTFEIVP